MSLSLKEEGSFLSNCVMCVYVPTLVLFFRPHVRINVKQLDIWNLYQILYIHLLIFSFMFFYFYFSNRWNGYLFYIYLKCFNFLGGELHFNCYMFRIFYDTGNRFIFVRILFRFWCLCTYGITIGLIKGRNALM